MNLNTKNSLLFFIFLVFSVLLFIPISCKKPDFKATDIQSSKTLNQFSALNSSTSSCDNAVCEDCAFQEQIGDDTTQYPTILGNSYVNPYSLQVMTQAYNNIHGTSLQSVPTTHYYVRFKPQDSIGLYILDSLDVSLYDYPLDRDVIQDGDYWPDAYTNLASGEIPWLYSVVESNFQFPAGIPYEVLAPLNIPDDDAALENEACRLTGNTFDCSGTTTQANTLQNPSTNEVKQTQSDAQIQPAIICSPRRCPEGQLWDPSVCQCVGHGCPIGYFWDGSQCVPDPSPSGNLHPQGMISFNTQNDFTSGSSLTAPLRRVRVEGRRWFKIDKTYTDDNGNFQFAKRFPNKVTIIVKLKLASGYGSDIIKQDNNGFGEWKRWFPLKKNIGTWKGNDLQNLRYEFTRGTKARNWTTRRWIGCIALNTVLETNNFFALNGMTQLDKLNIRLAHPNKQTETPEYEFLYKSVAPLFHVNGMFLDKGDADVSLEWLTTDINSLTASKITINVGQQLAIDYLYKVTGQHHWDEYSTSLSSAYNSSSPPFGLGFSDINYDPELLAIWQSFAQHLGHTVANKFFGTGEYSFVLQGKTWASISGGSSSSLQYLEQFDPNIGSPNEKFPWIPVGLITDLMDSSVDLFPINDTVSGFTYSEIQTALQSDPTTMADFKAALKTIKPSQATALDLLFTSYGY